MTEYEPIASILDNQFENYRTLEIGYEARKSQGEKHPSCECNPLSAGKFQTS